MGANQLGDDHQLAVPEPGQARVQYEVVPVLVVVVVVHQGADVVQQGRRMQPLPLARIAVVHPQPRQAVEYLERETRDLLAVRAVVPVHLGQVAHAGLPDVGHEGGIRGLEEGLPEHAPAQSLGAYLDAIDCRGLQKRIHHHRAGQHDVRPVGLEAGNAPALTAGQGGHALDEVAQGVPRQQEPVYLAKGVRGRLLGHRGESAHGASHGNQPGGIGYPRVEAQHVEGMAAQGAHIIGRLQIAGHEGIGHPHGAERLAHSVCEQPVLNAPHLDAAASELSDEAIGERGAVYRPQVPVAGLLVA